MRELKKLISHKYFRILAPTVLIIIWLALASIGGPTFGKLSSVSSNDQASFLPASADSTKVDALQSKFETSNTIPAIIVIQSKDPTQQLSAEQYNSVKNVVASTKGVKIEEQSIIGPIVSSDGKAVEFIVQIPSSADVSTVIASLRTNLDKELSGLSVYVTGPAGLAADLVNAFSGIDGILLFVAIGTVFVILLLVYRSIILPFLVLLTAVFALSAAILLVYTLASHGVIKLNGQSQGILSILVIGASTDYSLLIISRYREGLENMSSKWQAYIEAVKYSFEPITAAAATVILALLCLLFSDLNSNRSLGPIAAIGIVFSYLAALTLLTSFLIIFGRNAFWPFKPHDPKIAELKAKTEAKRNKGLWHNISVFISKYYRQTWIIITIVLVICALGLTQLKASGIPQSANILGASNSVSGQSVLSEHFPAGSGSPVEVIATVDKAQEVLNTVKSTPEISSASFYSGASSNPFASQNPVVVNDQVLINAVLYQNADSIAAQQTIQNLRDRLASVDPNALVGGVTAIALDTNNTAKADLKKIIPIVLIVILIILIFLLRSLLAPFLLIVSVILSFVASLGVSAIVFNHIFHFPGADPSVPLFGFIFLVALGVDYNIFLMSRVREESLKIGTSLGILKGLKMTGPVITSAGIVLAATFAALAVIPILFLAQIAFIVAFGVLLDSIIVRSLLIPALCYDIGKTIWWPSKLWKRKIK